MGAFKVNLSCGGIQIDMVVPEDFPWDENRVLGTSADGVAVTADVLFDRANSELTKALNFALSEQTARMVGNLYDFFKFWLMFSDEVRFYPLDKLLGLWQAVRELIPLLGETDGADEQQAAFCKSMKDWLTLYVDMVITEYAAGIQLIVKRHSGEGGFFELREKIYSGTFVDGRLVRGKITWPGTGRLQLYKAFQIPRGQEDPRKKYVGDISDWNPHGSGRLEFKNGQVLEGTFVEGELVKGKVIQPNGHTLEGDFHGGKLHGTGTVTMPDGRIISGTFEQGKIIKGRMEKANGTVLVGEFVDNGLMVGIGEIIQADGRVLRGPFSREGFVGPGTVTYPDGRVTLVRMVNGQLMESS